MNVNLSLLVTFYDMLVLHCSVAIVGDRFTNRDFNSLVLTPEMTEGPPNNVQHTPVVV